MSTGKMVNREQVASEKLWRPYRMNDFIQNVFAQVRQGTLSQEEALRQIRDFRTKGLSSAQPVVTAPLPKKSVPQDTTTELHPLLQGATRLMPVWDVVPTVEMSAGGVPILGTVAIGAAGSDWTTIRSLYPSARRVEFPSDGSADGLLSEIMAGGEVRHLVWLAPVPTAGTCDDEKLIADQQSGVLAAFRFVKVLLQSGLGSKELEWTLITHGAHP
ncbi:MAG TPA: hypothetical protein VMF06_21690, partial [Candidatus Limnocylindria bacterium]|nr:hypothetical protein [Candidatus Limnocylindria bacterium]